MKTLKKIFNTMEFELKKLRKTQTKTEQSYQKTEICQKTNKAPTTPCERSGKPNTSVPSKIQNLRNLVGKFAVTFFSLQKASFSKFIGFGQNSYKIG